MTPTRFAGQRFLLSGASGLLGTAIRGALLASGGEIVQLVRRQPAGPRELRWDPSSTTPVAVIAALERLTAVIHLSGANVAAHRWTPAYRRDIWTSRVESTRALCTVLAGLHQPPRALLLASATGIYGNRGDEVLDEDSAPGTGFLADLCREWEDAGRPAANAGMRVLTMRFGVVLAREGGALARMLPAFRLGLGGKLGSGRQWMSWIEVEDLVSAVRFLLASNMEGPVNFCAPYAVRNAEFTRALARALHRPAFLSAPAPALRLAFGQMADEALLTSQRVIPRRLTAAGFVFARPQLEGALAAVVA